MNVIFLRAADRDLDRIAAHYAQAGAIEAAGAILHEIEQRAAVLADHPEVGRRGRLQGTRELVVTRYPFFLVYRIAGDAVHVLRVLHQRQQWPQSNAGG